MITISVLGPLDVRRNNEHCSIPTGKTTELLIRLAMDCGTLVRAERLIEDVWDADAGGTARNTLQSKVSRLRRALGAAALVTGGRAGYTLEIDTSAVDALGITATATAVRAHLAAGRPQAALDACTQASAMFRGEALCDAGDGEWVVPHRRRLEDVRLSLMEDGLDARLALGAAGDVVGVLEALVVEHPLRERLWGQLITALYRSGRQADALDAYRRLRVRLSEDLGLEPGPELRALEQQVLLHGEDLRPNVQISAVSDDRPTGGNLPALSSSLVGRTTELHELAGLLDTDRLVTIVGPAGVGKTRLALALARRYTGTDGAWLARLDSAPTAISLPLAVGESLMLVGANEDAVIDRLRPAEALLVLDNCEHVLNAAADLTGRLLEAAPRLRVLVTSQAPLGLEGECVYALDPLGMEDSVALFAQRAAQTRRSFTLDPELSDAIADVCRSLDGLPLAIELAAARTKALSVQEIARRLDDRLALLGDTTGRRPERHRTLRAAIAWSYDLLFPDEQRGLWALACFWGGAPLAAAEAVLAALGVPATAAVDVFGRLAERSLVAVDISAAGTVRYRLLDSVRIFVRGRMDEAVESEVGPAAHAAWLAHAADRAMAEWHGPNQSLHLAAALAERANIEAALAWTSDNDPALGLRIANGFGWASVILGEGAVGAERLRGALEAAELVAAPSDRSLALALIAWNEAGGDIGRARAEAERAVELADGTADPGLVAVSRFALAFALIHQGEAAAALQLLDDWDASTRPNAGSWYRVLGCVLTGFAGLAIGEVKRVSAACDEAAGLLVDTRDDWLSSHVEGIYGQLAQAELRHDEAIEHLQRAAAAARRSGGRATEGFHLVNLGRVLQQAGRHREAIRTLEEAMEIMRVTGPSRAVAVAQVRLGRLLRAVGEPDAARRALAAADDWFRASGGGEEAALAECLLLALDAAAGAGGVAARLERLLGSTEGAADPEVQVLGLDALALVRVRAGELTEAGRLLRAADVLMPTAAHRITEDDRIDAGRVREQLTNAQGR